MKQRQLQRLRSVLLILATCVTGSHAQSRVTAATVLTTGGKRVNLHESVRFEGRSVVSGETALAYDRMIRVDFPGEPESAPTLVFLSNGDRLAIAFTKVDEDTLFGTYEDQSIGIPLEFVSAIAFQLPQTSSARRVRLREAEEGCEEDTVTLQNDDQVVGEVQSVTKGVVAIQTGAGSRQVPRKLVRSVRFSSELQSQLRTDQLYAVVQTSDGCIMSLSSLKPRGKDLALTTLWGSTLTVPLRGLASIQFFPRSVTYLNDLKPGSAKVTPFLGKPRPWRRNRNVNNELLRHGGRVFVRGIGTTSRCELTWQLDGRPGKFHTAFGLDDSATSGAAVFRVLVDGKPKFDSGIITGGTSPHNAPLIDISNARTLTLVVDYGPRGDMQDFANWLDPVLIRND